MALPVLNSSRYTTVIPSTGQEIEYRPFLVKEEKILMVAMESKDQKMMLKALKDILKSCVFSELNIDELASFDLEQLFLKLRSKSVGETVEVNIKCKKCEAQHPTVINVEEIEMSNLDNEKMIMLTDDIGVTLKYPSLGLLEKLKVDKDIEQLSGKEQLKIMEVMLGACLDTVFDSDNVWPTSDQSEKEVQEFIEGLNSEQFSKLSTWFNNIPALVHTVKFVCKSCEEKNEIELRGLASFFT